MKLLELSFLFICLFSVSAEENLRLPDTRALALGGNGVTLSSFSNPALVQLSTDKVIHLEYFNRYALKELGCINGSFQYPNTYLSTGIHLASFGYERYRQNMARIFLGKQLNTRWMMGVSFQYTWIQSELYEEIPARLSTDIGVVYIPFDKLLIGCVARDLPSVRINAKDLNLKELRTYAVQIGFNWEVLNNLLITSFAGVDEKHRIQGGFGMEYEVWNCFQLRAGLQADPFLPSLGVGFSFHHWQLDAVALWHPVLGVNSGVGLSYSF